MAGLVAQLARRKGAVAGSMTINSAGVASARERTLDARVGVIRLVVTDLTAVVALAGEAAALGLVGLVACVASTSAGIAASAPRITTAAPGVACGLLGPCVVAA
jgi:hypothetical protein